MSESTEIATREEDEGALVRAEKSNSDNLLAQIVEASKDPGVDAGKMKAMADLAIQLQDRENQRRFNLDLANAISEMPIITKAGRIVITDRHTGQIIQSTAYAKFEDLDRVVKPIARRNNITYNFDLGGDDKRLLMTVILRHTTTGVVERSSPMPLPLETSGSKNNVQGVGSTNSFGKRYALTNAFAISTEGDDDDGNQGTLAVPQERRNIVIEEAEAAAAEGRYDEWFHSQSAKDRALMISCGKHAELGGQKALPGALPDDPIPPAEDSDQSGQGDQSEEEAKAAQWLESYEKRCRNCASLDDLAVLQDKTRSALEKIKAAGFDDLHRRAVKAGSDAYARLSEPAKSDKPGDDLFEEGGD